MNQHARSKYNIPIGMHACANLLAPIKSQTKTRDHHQLRGLFSRWQPLKCIDMKYLKALPNTLTKNVVSYKGKLNNYSSMSIIGLKLTQVHPLLKTFHEMERFCSNPSRSYSPTLQNSFEQDPKERNEHVEPDWQYQTLTLTLT